MKKYIIITLIALTSISCSDYLDVVPDNVPTIDHAFQDRTTTLSYLATCYSFMPSFQDLNNNIAQAASDEFYYDPNPFYGSVFNRRGIFVRNGLQTPENNYFDQWNNLYDGIRACNTFLDRVPAIKADLQNSDKKLWLAEVKILKAYYHFLLMKQYGAIPIIKENLPVDVDIELTRVSRDPFDNSIEYLVELIDEAMIDLPAQLLDKSTQAGHINQIIAATIKAEILITAASPLYNGNADLVSMKNNDGTALYSTDFDQNKWTLAAEASKEALDLALAGGNTFYKTSEYPTISETTKLILNRKQCVMERWNSEIIFATNRYDTRNVNKVTPFFSQEMQKWAPFNLWVGPTFATTNFFYSKNGVPINEDNTYPYEERYDIVTVPESEKYHALPNYKTMQINLERESRYYSNLAFDGARWFGNGRFKDIEEGTDTSLQSYTFNVKSGEEQGKNSLRYSPTGLFCRKLVHIKSSYQSANANVTERGTFAIYRLAELYLFYAEALNESLDAPTTEVYAALDAVRAEAGLNGVVESWTNFSKFPNKVTTKEGMRDIIQKERTTELAFEGKRYYDIRRWKTASEPMNQPIRGFNVDGEETNTFNQIITIDNQQFFSRDYFSPISVQNLRINKNLIQNPSW